jgi:hypothetical protein
MDCKQADIAMMQHMEKTISPADARDLAKHILRCENCREYFLAFDEAMDYMSEMDSVEVELIEAPANFTMSVMEKVRQIPTYSNPIPTCRITTLMRCLWGSSAVFLGVSLLFIFNPDWLATLAAIYPAFAAVSNALDAASLFLGSAVVEFMQSIGSQSGNVATTGLTISTLIFLVMIGIVLFVLHRGEKRIKT